MRHTTSFVVRAPLDAVAEAYNSEAYTLDEGNSRHGVISTTFEVIDEQPDTKRYEARFVEYGRTKLGKLDRNRTAEAVVKSTWNAARHTVTWLYEGQEGPRVAISGVVRLVPRGDDTLVIWDTDINIAIPIIAKTIAKIVAKQFTESMDRIQPILERHARAVAAE